MLHASRRRRLERALARSLDHRAKLEATTCPVLVMHAQGDRAIDPEHARQLAAWAGARSELVIFEQGNHNTIHFRHWDELLRRVVAFTRAAAAV